MEDGERYLYFTERVKEEIGKISDYPLTIVEAPMGYGKTTAVREQLRLFSSNLLWQSIYDHSETSFWNGFCHLIGKLESECAESLLQLQLPNDSRSLMTALHIIEKVEFPQDTFIVLDDYYLVESPETNRFIELLVLNEITNLHIILVSRYTNFDKIEELSLKGYLHRIRQEVFELTAKDITGYYKLFGIRLNHSEAERLHSFTEGWISALYLLTWNFGTRNEDIHKEDIYTLIEKVIHNPLPQSSKDLLTGMGIFESFTLKQAQFLYSGYDPGMMIDELVRRNAFIAYNTIDKTYNIHSILKDFLQGKFDSLDHDFKCGFYRKAANWYLLQEEYITSMHFAYLGGDFDTLLQVVERDKCLGVFAEHKELIIKYITECPMEVKKKHPYALLYFARKMFLLNEAQLLKTAFMELMSCIQNMDPKEGDMKNLLVGEYELLFAVTEYNDIKKMSLHHREACKLLTSSSVVHDGKNTWTLGSPSVLYNYHRISGELLQETETLKEAIPYYSSVANNHGYCADLMMEAERYFYMGDLENAEIAVHKTYLATQNDWYSGVSLCALFLKARIALMNGDFNEVLSLTKVMRENVEKKRVYVFYLHTLDICEAYIFACLKNIENIQSWILDGDFKYIKFFPVMGFINMVYGRVLLIKKEYLKLIGSAEHFIGIASVFPNILGQIHTYIYLAAANEQILKRDTAIDSLKKALDMALPDKVYMPFVENCDYIKPLLEELHRQEYQREDIARILELYETYSKAEKLIRENAYKKGRPVLAERENEVARLAAGGLSNKEIGERLSISQNTVKSLLKNVFEKLEVNSRVLLKQYFDKKS